MEDPRSIISDRCDIRELEIHWPEIIAGLRERERLREELSTSKAAATAEAIYADEEHAQVEKLLAERDRLLEENETLKKVLERKSFRF